MQEHDMATTMATPMASPTTARPTGAVSVTPSRYVVRMPSAPAERRREGGRVVSKRASNLPVRLLIPIFALVATFLLLGGRGEASTPAITVEHRVAAGDTLWDLAAEVTAPGEDVRATIDRIEDLNGLTSSALRPGQLLLLPAG